MGPAEATPVLTAESFLALCRSPPVQSPTVRLKPATFKPLEQEELPHPGMLLGIDAEFVALSPPDKAVKG